MNDGAYSTQMPQLRVPRRPLSPTGSYRSRPSPPRAETRRTAHALIGAVDFSAEASIAALPRGSRDVRGVPAASATTPPRYPSTTTLNRGVTYKLSKTLPGASATSTKASLLSKSAMRRSSRPPDVTAIQWIPDRIAPALRLMCWQLQESSRICGRLAVKRLHATRCAKTSRCTTVNLCFSSCGVSVVNLQITDESAMGIQ
jgi:hypothetical protein